MSQEPHRRCARHGLATGPDGNCALCNRRARRVEQALVRYHGRGARLIARVVVALVAGVFTLVVLLVLFDRTK